MGHLLKNVKHCENHCVAHLNETVLLENNLDLSLFLVYC